MKSDTPIPGILCMLILAICVGMLTCCADMPITVSFAIEVPIEIQK